MITSIAIHRCTIGIGSVSRRRFFTTLLSTNWRSELAVSEPCCPMSMMVPSSSSVRAIFPFLISSRSTARRRGSSSSTACPASTRGGELTSSSTALKNSANKRSSPATASMHWLRKAEPVVMNVAIDTPTMTRTVRSEIAGVMLRPNLSRRHATTMLMRFGAAAPSRESIAVQI